MPFTQTKSDTRRKRWRILFLTIFLLILAGYNFRERLQRVAIAIVIYREHIFTPPSQITNESAWSRCWDEAQFYWDMSKLRVAREKRIKKLNPSLEPLIKEINRKQAAGEAMGYSMHIYREIRWRLNFTSDTVATRKSINELRRSISQPSEQKLASAQQASDGSWGDWDAVKIFRYAWPSLDTVTREKVRLEISSLLTWCLTKSYQPDGSFKISDLDDTMDDAYRYGVAFLSETGYFESKNRFWTNQSFPEAKAVHDQIQIKLMSIGLKSSGLKDAYETLNGKSF